MPPLVAGRMKNMDAAKRALFSTNRRETIRFRAVDGAGELIDYTAHVIEWEFTISRDAKVISGSVSLAWDIDGDSLAPLIEASARNTDGLGGYAPALYPARFFDFSIAITPTGVAAEEADHVIIVEGRTGVPDFSNEAAIVWELRDMGEWLARRQIEDEITYPEQPLAERIQAKLDDWPAHPTNPVPVLVVEGDPDWIVKESKQSQVRLLEAIAADADQIGWDLRYDWTPADGFALVLREPRREVVDPDTTWTAGADYIEVPVARFDEDPVRNRLRGIYRDEHGVLRTRTLNNAPSAALFGYQFFQMGGDAIAAISNDAEMDRMLARTASDIGLPPFQHSYKFPLFPYAMLGDYYAFAANGVHYDTEQRGSVERIRHWGNPTESGTVIDTSAKPRSAYFRWLTKADDRETPSVLSYSLNQVGATIELSYTLTQATKHVRVWAKNGSTPLVSGTPNNLFLVSSKAANILVVSWPVQNGTWHVVIRPEDEDGRVTQVEDTLAVTGVGGGTTGGGTPTTPAAPSLEAGTVAGPAQDAIATWINNAEVPHDLDWYEFGSPSVQDLAVGAGVETLTRSFTAPTRVKMRIRESAGPGPWSAFSPEIRLDG